MLQKMKLSENLDRQHKVTNCAGLNNSCVRSYGVVLNNHGKNSYLMTDRKRI